jgi:hypothetical protein
MASTRWEYSFRRSSSTVRIADSRSRSAVRSASSATFIPSAKVSSRRAGASVAGRGFSRAALSARAAANSAFARSERSCLFSDSSARARTSTKLSLLTQDSGDWCDEFSTVAPAGISC